MKELSIEEKAVRYDEAIKEASVAHKDEDRHLKATLERIFPELKESEDERIKNLIYCLIRDRSDNGKLLEHNGISVEEALDWVGKQGENNKWKPSKDEMDALYGLAYITNKMDNKKDEAITKLYQDLKREFFNGASYENMFPSSPVDAPIKPEKQGEHDMGISEATKQELEDNLNKALEKETLESYNEFLDEQKPTNNFKVGDWITDGENLWKIIDVKVLDYILQSQNGKTVDDTISYVDLEFRNWTIEDAKDGDMLCYKDEISLYKHDIKNCTKQGTTFGGFVYHCCYDGKGCIMNSLYSLTEQDKMDIHPATKEERNLLFAKMKEACYEWDAEKKELKKIEQSDIEPDVLIEESYQQQADDLIDML